MSATKPHMPPCECGEADEPCANCGKPATMRHTHDAGDLLCESCAFNAFSTLALRFTLSDAATNRRANAKRIHRERRARKAVR